MPVTETQVATSGSAVTVRKRRRFIDVVTELRRPKVAVMLALGFSSGLPFLLTGNTLGYWLRDRGVTLEAIGFLSWVGFAYALKFLWSPLIDRLNAPWLGRLLGRRRGWMIVAQCAVGGGLAAMALFGTTGGLIALGALALLVAFASATQDIVIDAWRIEVSDDADELGLLSAAYQLGYRAALLVTEALILVLASHIGWRLSYTAMAALMSIGLLATGFAREPDRADEVLAERAKAAPLLSLRGISDAVVGPFTAFFKSHGALAALMLVTIAFYMAPDFVMGPMINPFYHDVGLSKDVVASIRSFPGLPATLLGVAAGGLAAVRLGFWRTLIIGQVALSTSIACYALLAETGPSLPVFASITVFNNFSIAFAGVALVSYMSSLTNLGYTATQYALLSSSYAVIGKFLKGLSGVTVQWIAGGTTLMHAYGAFFLLCGAIGIPALALLLILMSAHNRAAAARPAGSPGRERMGADR